MTDATWLDRAIGWISPVRGAKRVQARSVMGALLAYDGAKSGRRTAGWSTGAGSSADVEVNQFAGLMRDRARDLVRNNPHAAKGLAVIVANKIGTGIMCQPAEMRMDGRRPNLRKNTRLHERWKRWVDNCDIGGKLDLFGIQSLAERTRAESGEALVRFIPTNMAGPMDVPFRLQVLEPDYIDSSRHLATNSGNVIRHGIEYQGAVPVAYYLFDSHPGDDAPRNLRKGFQSRRVPADQLLHYFKPLRPGQGRGVTDFAPVMMRLRALDDYDDAEVMRKKVAACLAAFVIGPAGMPAAALSPTTTDDDGRQINTFSPGMVVHLAPGSTVETADPKPSTDYQPFNIVQLRAIAAGLGMPYELLTGDLSEVNYTSHRGGLVQFRGMVEADQWQMVVPQLCRPICLRFAEEAAGIDKLIDPNVMWTYTPPRFGLLDPAKEIPAMTEAIQAGIYTYDDTIRREGYDPAETLDAIEEWQKALTERGIVLTSDPRTKLAEKAAAEPAGNDEPPPMKPKPRAEEEEDEAAAA